MSLRPPLRRVRMGYLLSAALLALAACASDRAGTDEVLESSGRGPFFVFDLWSPGSGAPYRALFIRAPVVLTPTEVDSELVRKVALSLRLRPGSTGR